MLNKCLKCNSTAVWFYAPGVSQYCDDHVPRGCTCNKYSVSLNEFSDIPIGVENEDWKWIVPNEIWCVIDEKGRELPCCEYIFDDSSENDDDNNKNED